MTLRLVKVIRASWLSVGRYDWKLYSGTNFSVFIGQSLWIRYFVVWTDCHRCAFTDIILVVVQTKCCFHSGYDRRVAYYILACLTQTLARSPSHSKRQSTLFSSYESLLVVNVGDGVV